MQVKESKCSFCATDSSYSNCKEVYNYYKFRCPLCGQYYITNKALTFLGNHIGSYGLINCISENIRTNRPEALNISWQSESEDSPDKLPSNVLIKHVEPSFNTPIIHSEKKNDLLALVARNLKNKPPFDKTKLTVKDLNEIKVLDFDEMLRWLKILKLEELVSFNDSSATKVEDVTIGLSPKGWNIVNSYSRGINSNKVFIAMAFDWGKDLQQLNSEYIQSVKGACRECGYQADIVPQDHTNHIYDQIVAGIKEAKFVIADFTFNNRGAYFEAGYARALGKHVIHTVMDGHTDGDENEGIRLHFDVQQINYIKWADTNNLRERIRDRIKAVII